MNGLIKDFETYNRMKNLSEYTVGWYSRKLRDFAAWLGGDDPLQTKPSTIRAYIGTKIEKGLKPATVKGYFAALSVFYSFLVNDEVIDELVNPMRKLRPPKVPDNQIEPLNTRQVGDLIRAFNLKRRTGYRNYTICLLILDTGLRIGEVAGLEVGDVDFDRRRLKVLGKGCKRRWVYIGERMTEILTEYLHCCRPHLANGNNTLFPTQTGARFHPENASKIIMRKMDKIGIPRANSSAHRLRHTFAVNFLRGGGSAFHLQRLLGHSTLDMTKKYVMLADDDLAEAHRKASPVDKLGCLGGE